MKADMCVPVPLEADQVIAFLACYIVGGGGAFCGGEVVSAPHFEPEESRRCAVQTNAVLSGAPARLHRLSQDLEALLASVFFREPVPVCAECAESESCKGEICFIFCRALASKRSAHLERVVVVTSDRGK